MGSFALKILANLYLEKIIQIKMFTVRTFPIYLVTSHVALLTHTGNV